MQHVLLVAGVYAVGLLALAALIVIETELCPLSVRKALEKRPSRPSGQEEPQGSANPAL
jgi:hypothetical protein